MPDARTQYHNIIPVILAGGSGTRLWPLSRPDLPKQFQPLFGGRTLFQQSISCLKEMGLEQAPVIMVNREHLYLVKTQLHGLGIENAEIICEPVCRDTAPAILVAALIAFRRKPGSQILTFPSDHRIRKTHTLSHALSDGHLDQKSLIAFGIQPRQPETIYGYIKYAPTIRSPLKKIEKFVEKPDTKKAISYLKQGSYLWNSGMYLFPSALLIDQLQEFEPDMAHHCQTAVFQGKKSENILFLDKAAFEMTKKISIDHALMERTKGAKVLEIDPQWDDAGSWSSVWECSDQDRQGNVTLGNVVSLNSSSSYIRSEGKLTAVLGLNNVIVVTMDDAVLVADKSEAGNLKQLVEKMKKNHCKETVAHSNVTRPWGSYKVVEAGEAFQVKRICVNPGQTLSLQYHHHRAEHWTIVSGMAEVTVGDETRILKSNEDVFIPVEAPHRIANPFDEPVEFIEVQCGTYLGEDDIVRLDDVYGRIAE